MESEPTIRAMKPINNNLFLSTIPGLLMIGLFYSLALHLFHSQGQWPESIGTQGFPPLLVAHAKLATTYFLILYIATIYTSPGLFIMLFLVKSLRAYLPYLMIHIATFALCYGCMLLAPPAFLTWWWD
jgi:hypothetical protein